MTAKVVVFLCLFFSIPFVSSSQIKLENQFSLQIGGGYLTRNGYNISIGGERMLGASPHSINIEGIFQSRKYITESSISERFRSSEYLLKLGYYYNLKESIVRNGFLSFGGGGILGYEKYLDDQLNYTALINSDAFTWGGVAYMRFEYVINRISLFVEPQILYLVRDFSKFTFNPKGGVKIYL